MQKLSAKIKALVLVAFVATVSVQAAEGVKIQTFKTHSRVFFQLDPSVDAQLKSTGKTFEVFFKGISLSDFGAPLGEEVAWSNQFSQANDPRLEKIQFKEVPGGVKVSGVFTFPKGADAVVNPQMEVFDFRQNHPVPGYVVDFWLKKGSLTLLQWKKKQQEKERVELARKNEVAKRQRAERRLASEKRKAEIEDTSRFCRESLSEKNDIFLQFRPVHSKIDFKRWLPSTTPDAKLPYYEPKGKEKDAQYVRLALSLYKQGSFALVLKTLDFFDQELPNSSFHAEMKFLRANALIKLGLQDQANDLLTLIRTEYKDSPFALHSAMYLVQKQLSVGNSLAATETFLWLISHFPDYSESWVFHLGAAETLYEVKRTDRALKEYEWVAEKATDPAFKAEAAVRQADLYLNRFQYDQALAAYFQAIHYFPQQVKNIPAVHLNRAESLYGLGQFDRAKESFLEFLKNYPGNPEGWRATFRLGEIDARSEKEQAQADSRKWYYDTINAYPFSPGAELARLRLLPCGDHGGFDLTAMEHLYQTELERFNPSEEVNLVPFRALATLAHVRALITFNQGPLAVDLAIQELNKPGNLELHEMLRTALGSVIRKSALDLLAAGKKYEALTFYREKSPALQRMALSSEEMDYLLKLSQAASDLGLGDLAREIADKFAKINSSRGLAESTPADIDAKIKASEEHFAQAKALWVSDGMKKEDSIRTHLAHVAEESRFSFERELLYALMDHKTKKLSSALTHAVQAQLLRPVAAGKNGEKSEETDLRVYSFVAELQTQVGDAKAASEMFRNLEKHLRLLASAKKTVETDELAASLGVPPMPTLENVLLSQGRLYEKEERWGDAARTYSRAIEEKLGGNQAIFEYARSLQRTKLPGDRARAKEVLEKLVASAKGGIPAGNSEDFWTKLARETLADENTKEGGKQ